MFEIDPLVLNLNDERIIAYKEGRIRSEDLLKLINFQKDPFEFRNGQLAYLTKEEQENRYNMVNKQHKDTMLKYGGLNGHIVYDNIQDWLKVYPEILELYQQVKEKIDRDKCTSCAKNREALQLLDKILSLDHNRDKTLISHFLLNLPLASKILDKIPIDISEIPDFPRDRFMRNDISALNEEQKASILVENPFNIARKPCEDCGRKHVSNAIEQLKMSKKSTDKREKFLYAMSACAELNEASDELIQYNRALSDRIRKIRISIMEQK